MGRTRCSSVVASSWMAAAIATVAAAQAPSSQPPQSASSAVAHAAQQCGLRFDGVYVWSKLIGDSAFSNSSIVRFFEDGSVIQRDDSFQDKTSLLIGLASGEPWPRGTFSTNDRDSRGDRLTPGGFVACWIDIRLGQWTDRASLGWDGILWLEKDSLGDEPRKHFFEPFDAEALLATKRAREEAARASLRQRAEQAAAALVASIGTAVVDEGCSAVEFKPLSSPVYPAQTRAIAYQLVGTSEEMRVEIGPAGLRGAAGPPMCPSGEFVTRSCSTFSGGEHRVTATVSCPGDQAFRPGSYELRTFAASMAGVGGVLGEAVLFTIDGAARKPP